MNAAVTPKRGITTQQFKYNHASSSKVTLDHLPPLHTLIGWSHRPQAIAKCFISDVYKMQTLANHGTEGMMYASRDVFLLNQYPCRMVEIVAWVAGVDHKDTSMTVTLDDGDGEHVLPTLIRLHPVPSLAHPHTSVSKSVIEPKPAAQTFATASERRIAKRKATEEALASERAQKAKWSSTKRFQTKDIRVGDTVRIVGKVDEWMRRKADGSSEWVRQVVVDENAGGSICAVDPEEQYIHTAQVLKLHQGLYARPFVLPDLTVPNKSLPPTPTKNGINAIASAALRASDSLGMTLTSEAASELSMIEAEPELRDPTKLRSSQLTDRTFRQYMLDHMTQETVRSVLQLTEISQAALRKGLEMLFPEYRPQVLTNSSRNTRSRNGLGVFQPSTKINSQVKSNGHVIENGGGQATPTQKHFIARSKRSTPTPTRSSEPPLTVDAIILQAFTPVSVSGNERLRTLARLVVENEIRKDGRRRRRRIRDGTATKKDLIVESERKEGRSLDVMVEKEVQKKIERLVHWAIRAISEEGSLVQITLPHFACKPGTRGKGAGEVVGCEYGYLPLPAQLLFPLCIPHLTAERDLRKNTIRRKGDPKSKNGMTVDELTAAFRSWGTEGRWERLGDWIVEDALEWGLNKGFLRKEGIGYWLNEDYDHACEHG
ncbi:uncharacterized protein I303_104070 [Kwoniella dejecticola CBS 10117]|uniref:CST complex subunit Stn1 N-terminal domain-containing protein n=1 Tax=Kwoniella dejecticola CBS 10117 TaxID=1296121 RepID=A0A1A6A8I5_9TREE|nr:uncharacterized protein I303_04089 [Kwoniella dejecticola CBS 10117]OBR86365.1 hypothetical protein I303_04089 [Kwoniella dejecticola CBS 10117]